MTIGILLLLLNNNKQKFPKIEEIEPTDPTREEVKMDFSSESLFGFKTKLIENSLGSVIIRNDIKNEEEMQQWMDDYSLAVKCKFRFKSRYTPSKYVLYHRMWICHHGNQRCTGKKITFTGCEVSVRMKIRALSNISERTKMRREKDADLYPCLIELKGEHNHHIESADALPELIVQKKNLLFDVKSESGNGTVYQVDMQIGICDCPRGQTGVVCKHQIACSEKYLIDLPQVFQSTPQNRHWLADVALGEEVKVPPLEYFSDIKNETKDMSLAAGGNSSSSNGSEGIITTVSEMPYAALGDSVMASYSDSSEEEVSNSEEGQNIHSFDNDDDFMKISSTVKVNVNCSGILDKLQKIINQYADSETQRALQVFDKNLDSIRTSNKLNSFLNTALSAVSSGMSMSDATSIARQKIGMPRDTDPIGKGSKRKGNLIESASKRERSLSLNVS